MHRTYSYTHTATLASNRMDFNLRVQKLGSHSCQPNCAINSTCMYTHTRTHTGAHMRALCPCRSANAVRLGLALTHWRVLGDVCACVGVSRVGRPKLIKREKNAQKFYGHTHTCARARASGRVRENAKRCAMSVCLCMGCVQVTITKMASCHVNTKCEQKKTVSFPTCLQMHAVKNPFSNYEIDVLTWMTVDCWTGGCTHIGALTQFHG